MAERSSVDARQQHSANALPHLHRETELMEGSRRRSGGQAKRKAANSSSSASSKRSAKERAPPILPPLHNGPCTRARQSPNKFPGGSSAANKQEFSQGMQDVTEVLDDAQQKQEAEDQMHKPLVDTELEAVRSRDANVHVIPVPAGWFSWTKVHPLEEKALSSFFDGKSETQTSEKYLELRNLIMKKYHVNPQSQISLKDLSDLNIGDDKAKKEIMEFLSSWGLINFHPLPPPNTDITSNGVDETAEVTSLVEKLCQFRMHPVAKVNRQKSLAAPTLVSGILPESAIPDALLPQEGPAVEYHCNSCSADCSRKRYHCQKQADFDLCSECYTDGKFGSGMTSADFILMEPGTEMSGTSSGSWSDQETLLLLEALELYGENWNEIAEHVATKTKAQCFLHFVRMPIEDVFIEREDTSDVTSPHVPDSAAVDKDPPVAPATGSSLDPPKAASEQPDTPSEQVKNDSEPSQAENGTAGEQPTPLPPPPPSDAVKPSDDGYVDDAQENHNFAIDALKAAFQAVGSSFEPGGSLSFADAGNPVMALVGYLAALVDPDVSDASVRSSLKAFHEDSPGIQLASRHCFFLEDPPDSSEGLAACKSDTTEAIEAEPHKEEKEASATEGGPICNDSTNKTDENVVTEAKDPSTSPQECTEKPDVANESNETESTKEASSNLEDIKPMDIDPNSVRPMEEDAKATVASEKTVETNSNAVDNEMKTTVTTPETDANSCKVEDGPKDSKDAHPKDSNDAHPKDSNDAHPKDSKDAHVSAGSTDATASSKTSVCSTNATASSKVRRAAIAALSAAAVKAKLLADQEEEQIRQLCSFVIERQLHKLESKLGLFSDIERIYMRLREQIDRARQRLMLERNQIIAARFGLPASMPRMGFQSTQTLRSSMTNNAAFRGPMKTFSSSSIIPGSSAGGSVPGLSQTSISSAGGNLGPAKS
ncbi:SWI/SNF complex subunit SWI3D [Nymphaea colorata]|nr:SWI/SNF complex subunit SWI3D [Nymphaea colorata]XP_031494683.1 SWI/SNF complex subunit SWI3D [Nymphaea colorata]XP_049935584.1 SWI/SNF complex subunit SWI3D [Nymphaea colorata]